MKELKEVFQEVSVTIEFTERFLGTVPKNPDVYKKYIEELKPEEIKDEEYKTVESKEEGGWTGFHKDEKGLFIYDYMVKGFLKTAGNNFKDAMGVKALRSKIDEFLFVSPRQIYLGKTEPDGIFERPLRCNTMQGPRVALARSDYIDAGIRITFVITFAPPSTEKMVSIMLDYGQYKGLGQFRNGGFGRFKVVM